MLLFCDYAIGTGNGIGSGIIVPIIAESNIIPLFFSAAVNNACHAGAIFKSVSADTFQTGWQSYTCKLFAT